MRSMMRSAAMLALVMMCGCKPADPASSNALAPVDPATPEASAAARLLAAAEPCVAKVDALLDAMSTRSIDGPGAIRAGAAGAAACAKAGAAIDAAGAPEAVTGACRAYVDDNLVLANLIAKSRQSPSRDNRSRVAEALARRDRSRQRCATAS